MRAILVVLALCSCDRGATPSPDAALPRCADLGCPGELLCSSTSACACHGQACTPSAPADAGAAP